LIVSAGAISFSTGIGPAQAAARPPSVPAQAITVEQHQNTTRLVWNIAGSDPKRAAVEVVGADPAALQALAHGEITRDRWNSFLTVRVVAADDSRFPERPSLWGSYRVAGSVIRFEPRFPLEPGMNYRAEFDPARLQALARELTPSGHGVISEPRDSSKLAAEYSPAKKAADPTTRVAEVYPTSDRLPENLLRFYLTFTAPMSRGAAYRHIKLVDAATGTRVDSPFLELDEELWSPDGTRFTLLLDPGRVKRGLRPREELGPILEAGKSYALVVDGAWPDAAGHPLTAGFRKTFRVGPPDESSPDPKTWTIQDPPANSREPLEIRFPESLDRALLYRLIWIQDAAAQTVAGEVALGAAETRWRFTPASPWRAGEHRLVVGTELEDVAGNSVARPFEVDVAGPISGRITTKTVELPFRIGPGRR
jgi:hypothetical protein